MNKLSLLFCISLIIFSEKGFSDRVTININARVIERSCTIESDSLNKTIDLQGGDLRQSAPGIPFGQNQFSITLVDCPANIASAHIRFSGESDPSMSGLLKNSNDTVSAAQGIALALYNAKNEAIDINNNENVLSIDHGSTSNSFDFSVYYVKVNSNAVAGKVTAVTDFEVAYD